MQPVPVAVALGGGLVVAVGYMAVFLGVLWVISCAFK